MKQQRSDGTSSDVVSTYSFAGKETAYADYRPRWPLSFARASLEKANIFYDEAKQKWFGTRNQQPIVVCIGAGTGADPRVFLQAGCIVYGVEPNETFRKILSSNLARQYPQQFYVVDGTAHRLNLPAKIQVDLIVCAQSLHTFRSECINMENSEEKAWQAWAKVLPVDNQNRIAIWYYNLDASKDYTKELHNILIKISPKYALSKTSFLDAPFFEPREFRFYIGEKMSISRAEPIQQLIISHEALPAWLSSFSFGPQIGDANHEEIIQAINQWVTKYAIDGMIHLDFLGCISQGQLRLLESLKDLDKKPCTLKSPLSSAERQLNVNQHQDDLWVIAPVQPAPLKRSQSLFNFFNRRLSIHSEPISVTQCLPF